MITVSNLSLSYSGTPLFSDVNLQFLRGNCYGIIGANGAGKSTFLKILSGELESTTGSVDILPNVRMSILKQDQFMFDEYTVLDTVIMGNRHLYDVGKEMNALYEKEDMTDEDGIRASELAEDLEAPVLQGQVVGEVVLKLDDKEVATYPIRAAKAVGAVNFGVAFRWLFDALLG